MLNDNKSNLLTNFSADIFTCKEHHTANGLSYWILRLLVRDKLVDAFHWQPTNHPMVKYNKKDSILVAGSWAAERKECFHITHSTIITSSSANDEIFNLNKPYQLEFDFGDDIKLIGEG
jgi:hypothetical protein